MEEQVKLKYVKKNTADYYLMRSAVLLGINAVVDQQLKKDLERVKKLINRVPGSV